MQHIDPDHHDGTSDATPGGDEHLRRPGELAFGAILLAASLGLLWSAYGISGFEALSAPGSVPMATSFIMVVSAGLIVAQTAKKPLGRSESFAHDILPRIVLIFAGFLVAYGLLLRPFGFLPTSALFLIGSIKLLSHRGWGWSIAISLFSLAIIWLVFRIVFSVLMPPGLVPEAEFIQFFRNLLAGGPA